MTTLQQPREMDTQPPARVRTKLAERKQELLGFVEGTEKALGFLDQGRPTELYEEDGFRFEIVRRERSSLAGIVGR